MGECVSMHPRPNPAPLMHHPLFIPEILAQIFEFLKMEDIKNCCAVHRSWNSIGEPMLEKKLKIPSDTRASRKYLKKFSKTFPLEKANYCSMRRYHIKNENRINYKAQLNVGLFENFVKSRYEDMLELTLYKINLSDDKSKVLTNYQLNSAILGTNVRKLQVIGTNLTTLVISLEALTSLNVLILHDCQLDTFNKSRKISLEEINLKGVNFIEGGQGLKCVTVNKVFDFTCTKRLQVDCGFSTTALHLDMSDASAEKLTFVCLSGVKLQNWEICTWNLKQLTLAKTSVERTPCRSTKENGQDMKIQELEFIACKDIDSFFLPANLQKLTLGPGCQIKFDKDLNNTHNCFAHLKYLCVSHAPNTKQLIHFHDN